MQNTAFDEGTVDSFFQSEAYPVLLRFAPGDFELTAGDGSRPAFDWISFCISHQRSLHIQTIDLQWPPSGIRIRQFLQAGKEEFKIFSSQSQGHPALLQWSAVPAEVFSAVPANPLPVRCIAGALGFSAEDTAEAIGLMANSGIKASQAGTSLRTIMNNLSGEVTFVGKNIGEVTVATSNADGSMRSLNDILADCRVAFSGLSESEKAANAEALVGKNAMSGFLALMNSSETDINKLRGAIENCDGASESMAETMQDNLNGQLTILKSQLEELAISLAIS